MRTKTLLLIAAAAAAGMVASNAQVYSVNAVGYVNTPVPANGFALISNPLTAQTNTIAALFGGQVPDGTQIFVWQKSGTSGSFGVASWDAGFQSWNYTSPDLATTQITPGTGVFVKNPTANAITITFVGEVPQGTPISPATQLTPGLQIVSSQVPQAGVIDTDLGYPTANGDLIYQWDPKAQTYNIYSYDAGFGQWNVTPTTAPANPTLGVGEAVFASRSTAGTWSRNFSVNQ